MAKKTGAIVSTQFAVTGLGRHLDQEHGRRDISSAGTTYVSSLGHLTIRIDRHKSVAFTYDADVMERRRANVRANQAVTSPVTSNEE